MAARREPMSNVDTAWLRMDDPTNLMMITGVLTFAEPLTHERVRETLENRLLCFDRFRQRVARPQRPLGTPYWELDPRFDIDVHLRRAALPAPADQEMLQMMVSDLMSVPLDPDRPLWQFHLIEEYQGGSALIGRLHHCIADGIALMRVLLSLTDTSREGSAEKPPSRRRRQQRGPLAQAAGAVRQTLQMTETILQEGREIVRDPSRAVDMARTGTEGVARLGQILARWPDPKTVFKGQLGVPKRAAWSDPIALADVKAVGRVTGGTVNDILLAAMAGGLRRYLQGRGERVDGLNFHAVVPVNLRPLDGPIELGNKFGLVFLALPIGIEDVVERLAELKRRMDELKNSPEAIAIFGLLNAVGMAPGEIENVLLTIFGTKATGVMTNVPGPRQQLYVAGSPLEQIMFWVPQSGRLGLGVSILSYNGDVLLGVVTDAGLVPDPGEIVAGFHEEFAKMMELVSMVRADPAEAAAAGVASGNTLDKKSIRCEALTREGRRCRNRARPGAAYCHVHQPA